MPQDLGFHGSPPRPGKTAEADQLLSSVYNRLTEGFETADSKTARALIHEFRSAPQ